MKEFKIFIASSNDEKNERNALKDFLQGISRITHDYGIEFLPVMWEMESVDFADGLSEGRGVDGHCQTGLNGRNIAEEEEIC